MGGEIRQEAGWQTNDEFRFGSYEFEVTLRTVYMWSSMAASNLIIEANSRDVDVRAMARTKAMSVNEITLKRNVEELVNKGGKGCTYEVARWRFLRLSSKDSTCVNTLGSTFYYRIPYP